MQSPTVILMMNMFSTKSIHQPIALFIVCIALAPFSGCSGNRVASQVAAVSKTNLQKLSNIYSLYVVRNGYKGPKDEETFRDFLEHDPTIEKNIGYMGVERGDFDKISISERDDQPMLVRYGLKLPPMSPKQPQVLETVGVDGVRMVIMSNGDIVEVEDDAEYEKMASGKWKEAKGDSIVSEYDDLGK